MKITEDRLKHILAVATKMKEIVKNNSEEYPVDPDAAFVLGILHDIGYEFSQKQQEHANKGGLVLKEQGYKYWKEVYYHGIPQREYDSSMLRLLNYADMTTGPTGEYMTIQERINDISERYGKGSWQEIDATELVKNLGLRI
jgi:putative nucleotidyltransferase with HDIG domain